MSELLVFMSVLSLSCLAAWPISPQPELTLSYVDGAVPLPVIGKTPGILEGTVLRMKCTEGMVEPGIEAFFKNLTCVKCKCENGFLNCTLESRHCPSMDTCPILEPAVEQTTTQCCRQCKTCSYLGSTYQDGDEWYSGQDSCRRLSCKAGTVTMSRMRCVTPCAFPKRMIGYCCDLCPTGNTSTVSTDQRIMNDPCTQCHCKDGWCQCFRAACPVLDCPMNEQVAPAGACCAECRSPSREYVPSTNGCIFQQTVYAEESSFRPNPCTICKCQTGAIICQQFVCKQLDCPASRIYYDPRMCCPLCRDKDPLPCLSDAVVHKHDDIWSLDVCSKCKCENGQTSCWTTQCPHAHGCMPGYRLKRIKGQCCPVCEEKEATCTVYGDPHYETFDGRSFNFQGSCRYVLVKDCYPNRKRPPFTVVVQNDPRGTSHYAWTKRVTIRYAGRRYSLLPKKRVKLNSKLLTLPYISFDSNSSADHSVSIIPDKQQNVVVRLRPIDVKITWDGNSFVEVVVPATYQDQLCGMCGNYNHDADDDFAGRHGEPLRSSVAFGRAWQIGSASSCGSPKDLTFHKKKKARRKPPRRRTIDAQRRADIALVRQKLFGVQSASFSLQGDDAHRRHRLLTPTRRAKCRWGEKATALVHCHMLRSELFQPCRAYVDVSRFYSACLMDSCECPSTGRCYCESLFAYARECEKANIVVPWRNVSNCETPDFGGCSVSGAVFHACGSDPRCIRTCQNRLQDRPKTCDSVAAADCVPGCVCPAGKALHGQTCIDEELCPA